MLAYTIVLGHSIIPHHHHHNTSLEATQLPEHIGHDVDHHDENNDDDKGLSHEFAKYLHSSGNEDIYQKKDLTIHYNLLASVYIVAIFDLSITLLEDDISVQHVVVDQFPIFSRCISAKGLRAPPLV